MDKVLNMEIGSDNCCYVTGYTDSANFPTKNTYQTKLKGDSDVFITKLNSTGSDLIYSTYFGCNSWDGANDIAVD